MKNTHTSDSSSTQSPPEQELMTTPGGSRPRHLVQPAMPGQLLDYTQLSVNPPVLTRRHAIDRAHLPPDFTITPGGARHRSLLKGVQAGSSVDLSDGDWHIRNHQQELVETFRALPPVDEVPGFGTGWIAFTSANLSTATPLSSLTTTWTVPPAPRTQSDQLLYLFNGFQVNVTSTDPTKAGLHILQQVLQWGVSPDGGGPGWAIASWFAGNASQPAVYTSPLVTVNPGDVLVGTITLRSNVRGVLTYDCQFQGRPGTLLTVKLTDAPFQVVETLEVYSVKQATDFPNASRTSMSNIAVNTGATVPALAWSVGNSSGDSGQYALVINGGNPNGQVDLNYGYTLDLVGKSTLGDTSSQAPSLASQNGMLFLSWKGSGNDNLNVMLSADNGRTFFNKITSPESSDLNPALAAHANRLMIAWRGSGNDQLNVAEVPLLQNAAGAYDIHPFANKVILGESSSAAPALASHNGLLFLAWKGSGNDNLNVMVSTDGGHTFGSKMISPESSDQGPALVSHDGKLLIAWRGSGNQNLNVAEVPYVFGANGVIILPFANKVTLDESSDAAPSLASYQGNLFLAWRGSGNNQLNTMLSADDGRTFQGKCIYGDASDLPPTLCAHNGRLFLGWKGSGNDNLNVARVAVEGDTTLIPFEEDLTGTSGALSTAHQDPINQLDVLAIDSTGAVAVSWVTGEQAWAGPARLTPPGTAPRHGAIALAHQTSFHQLDAVFVDSIGAVNVMWVTDGGKWAGPVRLSTPRYAPPGAHLALAHQTAMNQLDALFVDGRGAINVMWVISQGNWAGPVALTRARMAPPGAPIALAHQTNSFQLDAFFVDDQGAINVMWVIGEGNWAGPVRLTAPGYAVPGTHLAAAHQNSMNQLNLMFIDAIGALNVMWVVGETAWSHPVRLTQGGFAPAGAPIALAHQISSDQLDALVVDNAGAVTVSWVVGVGHWAGPVRLTPTRFTSPGAPVAVAHQTSPAQLDAFVPDASGALNVLWVAGAGAWQGPARLPGPFVV